MSYSLVLSLSHSLSHSPSHSLSLPLSLTQSATCSTRNKRAVSTCHARVHHTGCARASATARHTHMVSRCFAHRLERIELLNGHRDELLLQCAQSRRLLGGFLCRTWLMEGDVVSFQPFAAANAQGKAYSEAARGQKEHQMGQPFMSMFAAFVNGPVTENPWRDRAGGSRGGMAEPIPQTAHLGVECGSVSGDVEHSRDPPERETSTNSRPCSCGGCTEHQQAGTHPPKSPPPSIGDRTGRPGTTDEQRAKDTESTRASTQEDGGHGKRGRN